MPPSGASGPSDCIASTYYPNLFSIHYIVKTIFLLIAFGKIFLKFFQKYHEPITFLPDTLDRADKKKAATEVTAFEFVW